jgi:hypothetical protein
LEQTLASAPDFARGWKVVCEASGKLGFTSLRLEVNGATYTSANLGEEAAGPFWSVRVPLGEHACLELWHPFRETHNGSPLSELADLLHERLVPHLAALAETAPAIKKAATRS